MKRLLIISLVFVSSIFPQEDSKKFTIHDYLFLISINAPQYSPSGKLIAYTVGEKEKWDGGRNNNIWLMSSDGKMNRKFTNSDKSDWNPKWSKDGSMIAFLSSRSEKTQVFVIGTNGGEARQVTHADEGVNLFKWIGSSEIAYVSNEPRDSTIVASEDKSGGGYVFGTKEHKSALWVQSINDKTEKRKITDGSYYISGMNVSSDGSKFVLTTAEDSHLYNLMVEGNVLLVDDKGSELISFNDAKGFSAPGFSLDDKYISFVANTIGFSSNNSLFITNVETNETINLTYEFDPTIRGVNWVDNETVAFKTPRNVYSGIYSVNINSGDKIKSQNEKYYNAVNNKIETLVDPYYIIYSYSINSKTKQVSFVGTKSQKPVELYTTNFNENTKDALQLTTFNKWINDKKISSSKIIKYPSYDGQVIEAVVTLPPDYVHYEKYPLLVLPHGGPDGIIMDRFNLFGQMFAVEGLIVFEPNFRGSIGYGSAFYAANRGRLGYIDYEDIMAGVDYLINEGIVDTSRMVVGGWSYGGYMTNWIIGHSNKFKAAVSVAGVSNTVSMYAQSDINHGAIAEWEFMGVPVLNMDNFYKSSPITFLKNCKTPTLIIHGEADLRVPVYQSWEVYRALVDLGVDVEMILYPNARHGIRAPKQFADVFTRWNNWYKKYLSN